MVVFSVPAVNSPINFSALSLKPTTSRVDAEFGFLTANSMNGLVKTAEDEEIGRAVV